MITVVSLTVTNMNTLLALTIASFLIATVLSQPSGDKCLAPASNGVAQGGYEAAPSEGNGQETGEGYRRRMRKRVHAKKLRAKALKKKLAKKVVKKARRKVAKKNKH